MMKCWLNLMGSSSHRTCIILWIAILLTLNVPLTTTSDITQPVDTNSEKCAGLDTKGVTFPKGDIVLEEGNPLEIYCKLHDSYMKVKNHGNSSNLVFHRDNNIIPRQFIQIINESTILLRIDNLTASLSNFYCKFDDGKAVCMNKVAIDTKPRPVQNFSCISLNWENLTCSWQQPKAYIETKYNLTYKRPGRRGNGAFTCPDKYPVEYTQDGEKWYKCFWNLSTKPPYNKPADELLFSITGTNKFGSNNMSRPYTFIHFARIKPGQDENLMAYNKTAHSATLSWRQNQRLANLEKDRIYQLMYKSQCGPETWITINFKKSSLKTRRDQYNESNFIYELQNLKYAHDYYDIRLKSKMEAARDEKLWSDFATCVFRTASELPARPPKTTIGSFSVSERNEKRDIYVYWQKMQFCEHNGDKFQYTVVVRENGVLKHISPNESTSSYAKFVGLGLKKYDFEIFATNAKGNSTLSSTVHVPASDKRIQEPRVLRKIVYGNHTYELSWKPPQSVDSSAVTNYTLFWCKNDKDWPYPCTGDLDWEIIPNSQSSLNKTFNDTGVYLIGISANTVWGTSGIAWATCTVIHDKSQGKMKNVWINNAGPTFIDVGWKLDCSDGIGHIIGYKIYYCVIRNPENPECLYPEQNITINGGDPSSVMHGNVTHLKPYTTYRLSVSVITILEEGPRSDVKLNATVESCPGEPRNVNITAVSNNSVTLAWDPPIITNGRLRYYMIRYRPLADKYLRSYPMENKSEVNQREITLTNLQSYTAYQIEVTACTVCDSTAVLRNVTTLIGVPSKMSAPLISGFSGSEANFSWPSPAIPGGPVQYELRREQTINGKLTQESTLVQGHYTMVSTCDHENIPSEWRIRAVTIDENKHKLEGPWSEAAPIACPIPQQSSYILIYSFVIMFFIIMLCVCVYISKKAWIQWKDMKEIDINLPPGLTTITGSDIPNWSSQRTIIPHTPLKGQKDQDNAKLESHYFIPAVQPLLLGQKKDRTVFGICDSDIRCSDDGHDSTDISNCDHSTNSEESSLDDGSCRNDSSPSPVTNMELDEGSNRQDDQESCSLRLRKLQNVPASIIDTANNPNSTWTKGYVTVPIPEKVDTYTGPWSKAMQLKNLDGYSQIAVENKQITSPPTVRLRPVIGGGYVPHDNFSPSQQNIVPVMIPQKIQHIVSSSLSPQLSKLSESVPTLSKTSSDSHSLSSQTLSPQKSSFQSNDDNECENSECLSSESLVDLPMSISSEEDLLDIEDNLKLFNVEVTQKGELQNTTSPEPTPYITLAQLPSKTITTAAPQNHAIAAMVNLEPTNPPTNVSSIKSIGTNPYSRVGMCDSTPTMLLASVTPPSTPSSSASNTTPTTPSK